MLSLSHQHRLGIESNPTSSNSLNFSFESDSFLHGISFKSFKESVIGGLPPLKVTSKSKFEPSNLRDDENLLQKNQSSSSREINFKPEVAETLPEKEEKPFVADFSSLADKPPIEQLSPKGGANPFAVDSFEPPKPHKSVEVEPEDGKVRLNLQCVLTETVLISEKSSLVEKFELLGVASGTITNHRSKSLLDEPDLHGHLGVSYTIGDPRSVIKTLVSGSKAVTTTVTDNADVSQKQVTASIDCKDINGFITKSKASLTASTPAAPFAIPAIPIFKYTLTDTFRPVLMKTKQIMKILDEGKIHLIVHVLFNTKVLTGTAVKDASVQVSCGPLGGVANVDCTTITVASTSKSGGVGKFTPGNKVITWSFGELKLKEQPAISMEATIELTSPAGADNNTVNATTLPSIYLPMIVKGVSDSLLSSLAVDVALPDVITVDDAEILFPGDAPASSAAAKNDNVLIHEIVEFRKQTKLECRFL